MHRVVPALLTLLLLLAVGPVARADQPGGEIPEGQRVRPRPAEPAPAPPPMAEPAPMAEVFKRNHLSVLIGAATDSDKTVNNFNGGIEYEYQFNELFGTGFALEGTDPSGGIRSMAGFVPLFIHPWRGLRLTIGPGFQLDTNQNSDFALRTGVGYRLKISESMTLTPEFNADLVDGDPVYVWGARIGYAF